MYGGSVKVGSFLHKNIWCEAVTERADMFALNLDCVVSGFMNLWSVLSVVWFLVERNPLVDTSKQFTLQVYSEMSVVKCEYLLLFSLCLVSICFSEGQVSSNRWIVFFWLSMITMSGFSAVTQNSGGMEPPPLAVCPGKSLKTVNLLSTEFTI